MARQLALLIALVTLTVVQPIAGTQNQAGQTDVNPQRASDTVRAVSEAVIVDLVVRDGRGRPVRDLTPNEVEVFEDGVKQTVSTFRLVSDDSTAAEPDSRTDVGSKAGLPQIDPFRHINLVTLVFERLENEGRQLSRQAALDFLGTKFAANTLAAVFSIDRRLHVLQQFTHDRAALREAVNQATSGSYSRFKSQSDAIRQDLERARDALAVAESQVSGPRSPTGAPTAEQKRALTEAVLARLTIDVLMQTETLQREQQGHASMDSLLALVGQQRRLPGRKTVILFSEGLQIPPHVVDRFRFLISQANLSNVSVYAVDARGLMTTALSRSSQDMLEQAAGASARQLRSAGSAVSREDVMIGESAEESLRLNVQATLAALASSTGGLLIANTNDARSGLRLIDEDIRGYYELAYVSARLEYDGKFRTISVKVSRPDVKIQTRSGYFALPPVAGPPVLPYEVPLLLALNAKPLPQDFNYQTRVLRFDHRASQVRHTLVMEVPLLHVSFDEDKSTRAYKARLSILAVLKDSGGRIVEKFSQDYPLTGPLEKREAMKNGTVVFLRQFQAAPGRYSLETVALDQNTGKSAARQAELVVAEPPPGVSISSLSVIRRTDPLTAEDEKNENPLRYEKVKIVPNLGEPLQQRPDAMLALHGVIYPAPASSEKPALTVLILQNGQVVVRGVPALSGTDSAGRIPFVLTLPLQTFKAGDYEVRALVQQGQSIAKEHAFFTVR